MSSYHSHSIHQLHKYLPFSLSIFHTLTHTVMELDIYLKVIGSLCLAYVVVIAWRLLNWVWIKPKKLEKILRNQGFKGNPYRLLYGDVKELAAARKQATTKPINLSDDILPRVTPTSFTAISKHGKKSFLWMGPRPAVYITDPNLIKEVLNKTSNFQKPRGGNPLFKLLANGLASAEGDTWAKHRKIMNPAFHFEKLKDMLPAMYLSCSEITSKWEEMVSTEGQCEVDVWPYLGTLTADVISRTAFGSSYEEGRQIFQLQKEQAELLMEAAQTLYLPGMRFLPTKRIKRMKQIDSEVRSALRAIINKRLKAMQAKEYIHDDLLGLLLKSNSEEIIENKDIKYGMSVDEVIEECKLFYFAGQETTSNLLTWAMVLLSQHSDWQERAREEVLQAFGKNKPDLDGLNRLKVVNMILLESLRLYPPAVFLSRAVYEDIKLGEIFLPAGVSVQLPIILMHHDKELWGDDAKAFDPERFSEGVSKATKGKGVYFPFGLGPRICIGQNFAMLEAKMALSMILQRFSFVLSPSYTHAPHAVLTIQPQHGANLILKRL